MLDGQGTPSFVISPESEMESRNETLVPEAYTEDAPLNLPPDTEQISTHFPNTGELAIQYAEKYGLEPTNEALLNLIEFHRAGRNLSIFCKQLSKEEKKPIFAICNPRMGGMLEFGFKHWLANFQSEEAADEFLTTLDSNSDYQALQQDLKEEVTQLHGFINQDLRNLLYTAEVDFTMADERLNQLLNYTDPSVDLRLELIPNPYNTSGKGLDYFNDFFGVNLDKSNQVYGSMMTTLHDSILHIDSIKDQMRAMIFQQAKIWIDEAKLNSFVYPINHWKVSGGVDYSEDADAELDIIGQSKVAHSIMQPDTLVVYADYHSDLEEETDEGHRGGIISQRARREFEGSVGTSLLREYIASTPTIQAPLKYPLSPNAPEQRSSIYKNMIERVKNTDAKIIDLQVALPNQMIDTIKPQDPSKYPDYIAFDEAKEVYDPNIIMDAQSDPTSPYSIRNGAINYTALRSVCDDLRQNPAWIGHFRQRIPLEPNYNFAGPEYY